METLHFFGCDDSWLRRQWASVCLQKIGVEIRLFEMLRRMSRNGKLSSVIGWVNCKTGVVYVLNESLEIGKRKRGCTNNVVDVSFNEVRQRTII